jgi:GNAT superfamily N-acetyltransferase
MEVTEVADNVITSGMPTTTPEFRVIDAGNLDPRRLSAFLSRIYGEHKARFLQEHGAWFSRGNHNRLVLVKGDEIAAYCTMIPTTCLIRGAKQEAIWWIDLVVAPEFRGQGLQRILDQEVRAAAELIYGFPNELAAAIHLKHGWGVREVGKTLLLPLMPDRLRHLQHMEGYRGRALRLAAKLLVPFAALTRNRLAAYTSDRVLCVHTPDPAVLAGVFARYHPEDIVTTYRDEEYVTWRYLQSPRLPQLRFYLAGTSDEPNLVLVTRTFTYEGSTMTYILDLFGDLADLQGVKAIIKSAVRDAIKMGATQVNALSTVPQLSAALRSVGFLLSTKARFTWNSTSSEIMQALHESTCHWTIADSDNDEPH